MPRTHLIVGRWLQLLYVHTKSDQSDQSDGSHCFSMEGRRIGRTKRICRQRSELGDQSEKEKLKVS